jgi:hypothetical protein
MTYHAHGTASHTSSHITLRPESAACVLTLSAPLFLHNTQHEFHSCFRCTTSRVPILIYRHTYIMYAEGDTTHKSTPQPSSVISCLVVVVRSALRVLTVALDRRSTTRARRDINGGWRVGRWQNLLTGGEMIRVMTDFRRMRFGLGVTMLTNGYFSFDVGGGWYGQPTWYVSHTRTLPACCLLGATDKSDTIYTVVRAFSSLRLRLRLRFESLGSRGHR